MQDGDIRSEIEKERKQRKGRIGKEIGSKRSDKEKERKRRKGREGNVGVRGGGRDLFSLLEEEDVIDIEADAIIT